MAFPIMLSMTRMAWDPRMSQQRVERWSQRFMAPTTGAMVSAMPCQPTTIFNITLVATATLHGERHAVRNLKNNSSYLLGSSPLFPYFIQ